MTHEPSRKVICKEKGRQISLLTCQGQSNNGSNSSTSPQPKGEQGNGQIKDLLSLLHMLLHWKNKDIPHPSQLLEYTPSCDSSVIWYLFGGKIGFPTISMKHQVQLHTEMDEFSNWDPRSETDGDSMTLYPPFTHPDTFSFSISIIKYEWN